MILHMPFFSWHALGSLVPTEHSLNARAFLSIVAVYVYPIMTIQCTVSRSQSNRALCDVLEQEIHIIDVQTTAWCYRANMDQNLEGTFPAPCLIYALKGQTRVQTWYLQAVFKEVACECVFPICKI